jgi:hypothetical protein
MPLVIGDAGPIKLSIRYVHKRKSNGAYFYYQRIPRALKHHYPNAGLFIRRSLGTKANGPQNAQSNTPAAMMRYGFDWLPWVVRNQSVRVLSIRQARRKDFSFGVENPTTIGS